MEGRSTRKGELEELNEQGSAVDRRTNIPYLFRPYFSDVRFRLRLHRNEVLAAVNDAIAEMDVQVDETEVGQAVSKSVEKLEERQKRRLKFLVSAYFMIWLVFSLLTYCGLLGNNLGCGSAWINWNPTQTLGRRQLISQTLPSITLHKISSLAAF